MTADDFKAWRSSLAFTKVQAAKAIGISVASVGLYERGSRYESNEPVVIPKTVAMACACLSRACLSTEAIAFAKAWDECKGFPDLSTLNSLTKIAENINLALTGHQPKEN